MGIKTRQLASEPTEENRFNISLLGFKMAVNEGLTVFNLVDGVVDEFHDESGTDEGEGSNDLYNSSDDYYINSTSPTGGAICASAGFSLTAVTEADTSTAGTNPAAGVGTYGTFTVPSGTTSMVMNIWGAGGSAGYGAPGSPEGGGGGFSTGTLAVTGEQVFKISTGEGGHGDGDDGSPKKGGFGGYGPLGVNTGGGQGAHGRGGGLSGIFKNTVDLEASVPAPNCAANVYMIAGSGGAGGGHSPVGCGGAGGGTSGLDATCGGGAEGGSQTAGGTNGGTAPGQAGGFLYGGFGVNGNGGGAGWYGGGSGGGSNHSAGGGGSSYIGHPQVTSGSTEAGANQEGGGDASPLYSPLAPATPSGPKKAAMNIGGPHAGGTGGGKSGGDGYVLITAAVPASTTATTITSEVFAATDPVTAGRIVVFEENVAVPTINTDIIASVSRDGGTTFTTATLADTGYVTGSSGQRILTGQANISGQPSGQSMRWKLALANNTVKIHGVSLQWS